MTTQPDTAQLRVDTLKRIENLRKDIDAGRVKKSMLASDILHMADTIERLTAERDALKADNGVLFQTTLERAASKCEDIYSFRPAYTAGVLCSNTTSICARAIRAIAKGKL